MDTHLPGCLWPKFWYRVIDVCGVCMCVCVRARARVCMRVCAHTHLCVLICVCVCAHTCMRVHQLMLDSHKNTTMSAAILCSAVYQWCYKQGLNAWPKYQICHEPTHFCSSLVMSKPRWLRFKAKKVFLFYHCKY